MDKIITKVFTEALTTSITKASYTLLITIMQRVLNN